MSKIETVIFDAGGVLHETNSAVINGLVRDLGLTSDVLRTIWAEQIPLLGSGKIIEEEFWYQVSDKHGVRKVDTSENLLGRYFAQELKPHLRIAELVHKLGTDGMKLAVLSNTIEPHARALRDAGLYDDFDQVFLSYEMGHRKPAPEIYQLALDSLGGEPGSMLFIDDDPHNVGVAKQLGMDGIVFDNEAQAVEEILARTSLT